jgi:general secretion pathway protein G
MKNRISHLLLLLFVSFVKAEESKKQKNHPAIDRVVNWAEAFQKGEVTDKNRVFSEKDVVALKQMGSFQNFQKGLSAGILKEKGNLTFLPEKDSPSSGMLYRGDQQFLPMKQVDQRWKLDAISLFKMVAADAREATAVQDMLALKSNLEMYKNVGGHYPSSKQGLMALLKRPTTAPRPRRWVQMIDKKAALKDPWGNLYQYSLKDGKPKILSLGPDGKASDDDITDK